MAWVENKTTTQFDQTPIEGLFFLSGNQLALELNREWVAGWKLPLLVFPSGAEFELWEGGDPESIGIIHLFGEMDLPLGDTRDAAYQAAMDIAEQCGYFVTRVGNNRLEVWGHDTGEHLLIVYDEGAKRMVDVIPIKEIQSRPRLPLLDEESRRRLPPLYSTEETGLDAQAQVKFFTPDSNWTWYASEFDGNDTFFGLVVGHEVELGYFSLSELESVRGPLGLPVERDKHYQPASLRDLRDHHRR